MYQDMFALLLTAAATPCPSPTANAGGGDGGSLLTPVVLAALISGVIAVLSLWLGSHMRRTEAVEATRRDMDMKALNEFYAPISELLDEVRIFRDEIKKRVNPNDTPGWHTLDHIEDIRADATAWALFEAIVKVNARIKEILDTKSGLALGAISASGRWRVHHSLLEHTAATPGYEAGTTLSYFPTDFENQISTGQASLVSALKAHRGGTSNKKDGRS